VSTDLADPLGILAVVRMTLGTFAWLLRQSLISSLDDGCFGYAKAAAYSALLSFFPVLTSAATILVQTRAEFVAATLENFLNQIVPPGTEDLVVQQFRVMGERPAGFLIAAGVISLWAASGVIKSLIEGFQAAYRVPRNRDFFSQSGVAMSLVLLSAIPLVCASLLIVFGGQVERAVLNWMKVDPFLNPLAWVWQAASRVARYVLAFVTTITVTSSLYYFGPNRKQRWHFVWRGATLATFLWFFATLGFAWYVRHLARYNVMYGSIGAGIALLVWMYLIALIALFGCEFNACHERTAGDRRN
jgi:membrane protein